MIIDVTNPPTGSGLVANDSLKATDNTAALQAMLSSTYGSYYFPAGRYWINDTIKLVESSNRLENRNGFDLIGAGSDDELGAPASPSSVIVWSGANDRPMFNSALNGMNWNGIGLFGSDNPNARPTAGIRIESVALPMNFRASGYWFGAISIGSCQLGIDAASLTNVDQMTFGHYECSSCDAALKLNYQQNVMWTFQSLFAKDVDKVFWNALGGCIFTEKLYVEGDDTTVLKIDKSSGESAYWHLGGLSFEPTVNAGTVVESVGSPDNENGDQLIRVTNARFVPTANMEATIDRPGAAEVRKKVYTVLQFEGCLGMEAFRGSSDGRITIKSFSPTSGPRRSQLQVFNSELDGNLLSDPKLLIDQANSTSYRYLGVNNWSHFGGVDLNKYSGDENS